MSSLLYKINATVSYLKKPGVGKQILPLANGPRRNFYSCPPCTELINVTFKLISKSALLFREPLMFQSRQFLL